MDFMFKSIYIYVYFRARHMTYVRLAPEDKYLSNHSEELIRVSVRFLQPPRPAVK